MKQDLLIVAAGKSSRFGGFPKAFAHIGEKMNVENTIQHGSKIYDHIFLGVNKESYAVYGNRIKDCEIFGIETGNGDAHSLLRCLEYVRMKVPDIECLSVCWGDAYFLNEQPFAELISSAEHLPGNAPVLAACAVDRKPYAWFETEGDQIKKARFKSHDGEIGEGIHDQSLFFIRLEPAIDYLCQYKKTLGIPERYAPNESKEMKLLYSFEFLYESKSFLPAQYTLIPPGKVLSFNTREELDSIVEVIGSGKGKQLC